MNEAQRQYDSKIDDAVREVVFKHSVPTRIYLFGSWVTGDAKPESDYGFAVDATDADLLALEKSGSNWGRLTRSMASMSLILNRPGF